MKHTLISFSLFLVVAVAAASPLGMLEKLHPGMTREQVVALLGKPTERSSPHVSTADISESYYYRLGTLPGAERNVAMGDTFFVVGVIRCDFDHAGVICHIAGLWPKPKRPPSGTPQSKVMLIDATTIYDHLAYVAEFNSSCQKLQKQYQEQFESMKAEYNRLLAERAVAKKKAAEQKRGTPERAAAEKEVADLARTIEAKVEAGRQFFVQHSAELNNQLSRFRALYLPRIADAALKYEKTHDFQFIFENHTNIFSPEPKPLFVSGIDVSSDVVKWINEGGARDLGLPAKGDK